MRTGYAAPEKYAGVLCELAEEMNPVSKKKPENFRKVMRENRGALGQFGFYGMPADGLQPRNPVIVALGDSVTAGHFEWIGNPEEFFQKIESGRLKEDDAIEVTDARECYLEKLRDMLIDEYEQTSVSVINSGIAGDTVLGMRDRLYRDVIQYHPHLVLINASLNWGQECGDTAKYREVLLDIVQTIKKECDAEIIMMTPNAEIPGQFRNPESSLDERVEVIRQIAAEEDVCLADTYRVWKAYEAQGNPVEKLLANGANHPAVVGHEVYATVLMKLLKK